MDIALGFGVGLFFLIAGWALLVNYRGFTTDFSDAVAEGDSPLRRIPPWRWMDRTIDTRRRRARRILRIIGVGWALIGGVVVLADAVAMILALI